MTIDTILYTYTINNIVEVQYTIQSIYCIAALDDIFISTTTTAAAAAANSIQHNAMLMLERKTKNKKYICLYSRFI